MEIIRALNNEEVALLLENLQQVELSRQGNIPSLTALGANGLEIIKTLTSEEISLLLKFDGGPSASCHSYVNQNSDNERNDCPSNPAITNQSEFFLKDVVDYGGAGIEGGLGLPSQSDILSLTPLANMLAIPTHEAEIASMPILSNQYILSLLDEVLNETSANKNNNVEETSGCLQEEPGPHNSNNEASISESEQSTSKDGVGFLPEEPGPHNSNNEASTLESEQSNSSDIVIINSLALGEKIILNPNTSAFHRSWLKVLGTKYEELLLGGRGDFSFEYTSPIDYKSSSSLGKYFDKQLPRQDIFIKRFLSMQKLILDIRNENGHSQQEGLLIKIAVNLIAIRRIGLMIGFFIQMLPLVEYKRKSDPHKISRNLGLSVMFPDYSLGRSLGQINSYLISPSSTKLWNDCVVSADIILKALFKGINRKGEMSVKDKLLSLSRLAGESVKKFMDDIRSLEASDEQYINKLHLFQKKIAEIENLIKEISDNCFNELAQRLKKLKETPGPNLNKITQKEHLSASVLHISLCKFFGKDYEELISKTQGSRFFLYRHPINYQNPESLGAYFDNRSSLQDSIIKGLLSIQNFIVKLRDKSVHNQHERLLEKIMANLSIIFRIALKARRFILMLPPVKDSQTASLRVYKDIIRTILDDRRSLYIGLEGLNAYLNNPTAERWNYCVGRAELTLAALFGSKTIAHNVIPIKFKLLKLSELGQKSVKKFMDNIQSLETSDEEYINKLYLFRKKNAEIENLIKELNDNCFNELAQQLKELKDMPRYEVTQVKRTSGGIEKRRELEGAISSESREATQLQEILSPNLDEVNQVKRIRSGLLVNKSRP